MQPQTTALLWEARPGLVPAAANEAVPTDVPGLLEHIVERYHRTHLRDLASAIALADEVDATDADDPARPRRLGDELRRLADDLEAHQWREEAYVFPMLRIGTPRCVDFVIRRMMDDHVGMDLRLDALHRLNRNHRPSFEASFQRQALSCLCRKLEAELREHAHLEHEVLYATLLQQRG